MDELIRVAEERIITQTADDLTADKLKNAAATKKLAIFDAFEIVNRIEEEREKIEASLSPKKEEEVKVKEDDGAFRGFAERRSKK